MKKRTAIWILGGIVISSFFLLEFTLDTNEKFKLKNIDLILFRIANIDSNANCYSLTTKIDELGGSNNRFLIGLRLQTEYISEKREGVKLLFKNVAPGDKGHVDTIRRITLQDSNTNTDFTHLLYRPAKISYIKILDTVISGNQLSDANDCLIVSEPASLVEIVNYYNSSTFKSPGMNNFYLFVLDSASHILLESTKLKAIIHK